MNNDNKNDDFKSANDEKFSTKERDILEKNKNFFSTNKKYINAMLEIINGESDISIRILDWFVANYSKKYNTCYKIRINGKDEFFYVNNEYKNRLNGYSKLYFDPFCRRKKVIYTYRSNDGSKEVTFISSIGQLNFFEWAIRNKIIKYVQMNIKQIEADMKETSKLNKEKKSILINSGSKSSNIVDSDNVSDDPDPIICSSDKINSVRISPVKKVSSTKSNKSESEKGKRQQLSKSVYEYGIKKTNIPIKLDFD